MRKLSLIASLLCLVACGVTAQVDMPLEVTNPADNCQTRTATGTHYITAPGAFDAFTTETATLPFVFTGQRRYTSGGSAGDIIVRAANGNEVWTAPASIVPPALVGPAFTIQGGPTLTPQIQAPVTGANQIAFASFANVTTNIYGAGDVKAAYRGTLGALQYLQTNDILGFWQPLSPASATEWKDAPLLRCFATGNHSSGVNPTAIELIGGGGYIRLDSGGNVSVNGNTTDLGGAVTANDITVAGTASAERLIAIATGSVSAPTLQIEEFSGGQPAGTRAIQVNDSAAVEKFFVDLNGDTTIKGELSAEGPVVTLGAGAGDTVFFNATAGSNLIFGTGFGIHMEEGTNGTAGMATLVAGTVTIPTTAFTATSRVLLTVQTAGGTQGFLSIANPIPGTSFDILSTSATDTSTVYWIIFES